MRVLVMTNVFPNPFQPQRATYNREQLKILAERHAVRVVSPILWNDERTARRAGKPRLPAIRRVELDGITVDHPKYWYTPKVFRSQYGRFYLWSVQRTMRRVVNEFKPDILFTPWAYPDGWAAVQFGREFNLPVVLQVHGSDVRLVSDFAGREVGTAEALRNADGVVAVSTDLAERVVRLGANPETTRVNIDGVDKTVFYSGSAAEAKAKLGLQPNVRHLLFVGSLAPVKGLDVLLNACAQFPTDFGDWELHLIGEGELRKSLERQAQSLGLQNRVRFHGGRPHADLPDWFRAADAFVMSSHSEGTPTVLLEASACGCPFVATAVGGIPAIAHMGHSRIVPPNDPIELSRGIVELLQSDRTAALAGPRDRREAVDDLEEFLQQIIDGSKSNRSLVHPHAMTVAAP